MSARNPQESTGFIDFISFFIASKQNIMRQTMLLLTLAIQVTIAFAQKQETKMMTMIVRKGELGQSDTILYNGREKSKAITKEISIIAGDSIPKSTTITIHANDVLKGGHARQEVYPDNIKMIVIQDGKEEIIDLDHTGERGSGIKNLNIHKIIQGDSVTISIDSLVLSDDLMDLEVYRDVLERENRRNTCDMQWTDGGQSPLNPATLGVLIEDTDDGVIITDILEGSAAQKTGLRRGDVILKINKRYVFTSGGLLKTLHPFKPGDKIKITCLREGKAIKRKAILQKRIE